MEGHRRFAQHVDCTSRVELKKAAASATAASASRDAWHKSSRLLLALLPAVSEAAPPLPAASITHLESTDRQAVAAHERADDQRAQAGGGGDGGEA